MPSYLDVNNGNNADASSIQQVIDSLKGTAGKGIPTSLTSINDAINFALAVKNNDATASKAFIIYKADGSVLFQADKNGVIASPDGIAGASQIPTLTGSQTLTNKTLTSPVISGAGGTPAGTLGFSGTVLQVGDGTTNEGINVGAWTTFAPTLAQGSAVAATVNVAHYLKTGRRAEIFIQMTASAAGTAANPIIVASLPAAILPLNNNTSVVTGVGYVLVGAGPARVGALVPFTSGQLEIFVDNAGLMGIAPAVTLANGSIVTMWGSWETAS